ncbi:hypothetical protein ACFVMC_32965 [Nocardia sp. NPDC127579]|uniref:hypothetical protein n=1 Tax=Nocardia sp. NPDC127579 TaxID=3345402 RepID=UPI00363BD279
MEIISYLIDGELIRRKDLPEWARKAAEGLNRGESVTVEHEGKSVTIEATMTTDTTWIENR